jgi:hypothetical protein
VDFFDTKLKIQADARRLLPKHADEYASIIAMCTEDDFCMIEVRCVLAFAGYNLSNFMLMWAEGAFDV